MTERFNVSGALLVKLFGKAAGGVAVVLSSGPARVRDIGVRSAMYGRVLFAALSLVASLAQALVYGLGGYYALTGQLSTGTVVTLALLLSRLYGPLTALSNARVDVMSALVSFDRVFEVLDLEPLIADAPDAVPLAVPDRAGGQHRLRGRLVLLPDRAGGVAGLAGGCRGAGQHAQPGRAARGQLHRRRPARWWRWSGRPVPARPPSASWCRGSMTSGPARSGSAARTSGRSPSSRCATPSGWSARTPTCSTTRSRPTCATPGRTPPTSELWQALDGGRHRRQDRRAAGRAGHRGGRPRLPAVRR